jgi:uncharacterized protein with HEPN domain
MRRRKGDAAYLWDMLDASRAAREIAAQHTREEYDADRFLRLAAERLVEIIGEAARHVSPEFKQAHPEIPWQRAAGQRHVLAHDYDIVDHDLIWIVITEHLEELIAALGPLVPEPPEREA